MTDALSAWPDIEWNGIALTGGERFTVTTVVGDEAIVQRATLAEARPGPDGSITLVWTNVSDAAIDVEPTS